MSKNKGIISFATKVKPHHWAIRAGLSGRIDEKVNTMDYVAHGQTII